MQVTSGFFQSMWWLTADLADPGRLAEGHQANSIQRMHYNSHGLACFLFDGPEAVLVSSRMDPPH